MLPTSAGLNPRPPSLHSNGASNWATESESSRNWMANSVDLEQWPRSVPYDLGLYSLLRSVCPNTLCKYDMERWRVLQVLQEENAYFPQTPGNTFGYCRFNLLLYLTLKTFGHINSLT